MGLLDTILGRTKPVRANLDALFALPAAAVTLQVSAGVVPTGRAGVCFKPPAGQPFAEMQAEIEQLLATPDPPMGGGPTASAGSTGTPPPAVRHVGDKFGYRWILVEATAIDDLVTRVHMVHSSLQDAGWSTQLLCSVFGFAPAPASGAPDDTAETGAPAVSDDTVAIDEPIYLVYLAKQGTFYPFAPRGEQERDTELELRLRSVVGNDLPIENDLSRWFPIWDLPVA
jgi:hypothetical protein